MSTYTIPVHRSIQRLAAADRRCSALWAREPTVAIDGRDELLRRLSAVDHDLTVLTLWSEHAVADELDEVLDSFDDVLRHAEGELDALALAWSQRSAA